MRWRGPNVVFGWWSQCLWANWFVDMLGVRVECRGSFALIGHIVIYTLVRAVAMKPQMSALSGIL